MGKYEWLCNKLALNWLFSINFWEIYLDINNGNIALNDSQQETLLFLLFLSVLHY